MKFSLAKAFLALSTVVTGISLSLVICGSEQNEYDTKMQKIPGLRNPVTSPEVEETIQVLENPLLVQNSSSPSTQEISNPSDSLVPVELLATALATSGLVKKFGISSHPQLCDDQVTCLFNNASDGLRQLAATSDHLSLESVAWDQVVLKASWVHHLEELVDELISEGANSSANWVSYVIHLGKGSDTGHWVVALVNRKEGQPWNTIEYFDSFGTRPSIEATTVLEKISHFHKLGPNSKKYMHKTQHQHDSFSCGVFAVLYPFLRITGKSAKVLSKSNAFEKALPKFKDQYLGSCL